MFTQIGQLFKKPEPEVIVIVVPRKLEKGEYDDVIAVRHPRQWQARFTNIPCVIDAYGDGEMSYAWGYTGGGPSVFAINILMHFTNGDEIFSRTFHIDFRNEFVAKLPDLGGRITKEQIYEFIIRMHLTKAAELKSMRELLGGIDE